MSLEKTSKKSYIFNNVNVFLGAARRAYGRTVRRNIVGRQPPEDAFTAILLSCVALEAYINETSMLINAKPDMVQDVPKVKAFASVLSEAESGRSSIRLKFLLALALLKGETFDKGASPYQDFDLLFVIRDDLMHYKLEAITESEPHKIIKRMSAKKLCEPKQARADSWAVHIATPDAARWACNTAVDMINTIQTALSDEAKKQNGVTPLQFMAAIHFSRLPEIDTFK